MQIRVVPCWGWYLPNTRHGCDRALLNTSQGCNRCLLHKFRLYLVLGFLLWCKSRLHCFGASVWLKVKNVIWRQFVQFKMYCVGVPVENWIILFCYGMPVLNKSRNDVVLGRLLLCSSRQSACLCDGMNAIVGHVHLQVYQCNSMQGALLQRERERERERERGYSPPFFASHRGSSSSNSSSTRGGVWLWKRGQHYQAHSPNWWQTLVQC